MCIRDSPDSVYISSQQHQMIMLLHFLSGNYSSLHWMYYCHAFLWNIHFPKTPRWCNYLTGQSNRQIHSSRHLYPVSYTHLDVYKRQSDYNAFKGNAYGLAKTLTQTAILKPSIKNKKLINLYYTGQLTVPGPGVPPSLISGEVVANQLLQQLKLKTTWLWYHCSIKCAMSVVRL